jgi:hypothetical protein
LDLGLQGLALLIVPALAFGLLAQAILWRHATHWLWLIAAVAWVLGGLFVSEVMFGAEISDANLQPFIDGLVFDEALFGGLIAGTVAVIATWLVTRGSARDRRALR